MLLLLAALSLPLLVLSLPGTVQGPTKGAPWTEEEALVVKAKLYAIIGEYGSRVRQTLRAIGTKSRAVNDPLVFTITEKAPVKTDRSFAALTKKDFLSPHFK